MLKDSASSAPCEALDRTAAPPPAGAAAGAGAGARAAAWEKWQRLPHLQPFVEEKSLQGGADIDSDCCKPAAGAGQGPDRAAAPRPAGVGAGAGARAAAWEKRQRLPRVQPFADAKFLQGGTDIESDVFFALGVFAKCGEAVPS